MRRKYEITGGTRRDEDEAARLCGEPEAEAMERTRPHGPRKPDPSRDVDPPGKRPPRKPDPFSDVDLPRTQTSRKPDPY